MNYAELLQNENWRIKREEILKRDSYCCQRCGKRKNFELNSLSLNIGKITPKMTLDFFNTKDLFSNLIRFKKENMPEVICKTNYTKNEFISQSNQNKEYSIIINFVDKNLIKYPYNGSFSNNLSTNIFHESITNYELRSVIQQKKITDNNVDIDKEGIWFVDKDFENEFAKNSKPLQVHHKCYRKDIEIWAQINNEYVSLCNVCHQIVHNNQLIPFFDSSGRILQYLRACSKCNGKRYLECYKHVNNGICFECNGSGIMNNY